MANLDMILAAIINAISNRLLQFHDDLTVIWTALQRRKQSAVDMIEHKTVKIPLKTQPRLQPQN